MRLLIVEIKARCDRPDAIRQVLIEEGAVSRGVVQQVDTYFKCQSGRLKLRESTGCGELIHYAREDRIDPKTSVVTLYPAQRSRLLKRALTDALGVLAVVEKRREIYALEDVVFHLDAVEKLGAFVEIEARDPEGAIGRDELLRQCEGHMRRLGIGRDALIEGSYSDMLLASRAEHAEGESA